MYKIKKESYIYKVNFSYTPRTRDEIIQLKTWWKKSKDRFKINPFKSKVTSIYIRNMKKFNTSLIDVTNIKI